MPHKHWYDESFSLQTYHKETQHVPAFLFEFSDTRIGCVLAPYSEFYRLIHNLLERSGHEWANYSFVEIVTELLTFIDECQFHNFSLMLVLWDREEQLLYSCNFNMPPMQIRTVDDNCIELNQINSFPLADDSLVIDTLDTELIDTMFATDSWIAYHLYQKHFRTISFKKDMLMLLGHYGIPQHYDAMSQFVLMNAQTTSIANIVHERSIPAKISSLIDFEEEFEHIISRFFDDERRNATATFVLNELLSNAYEYGVLGLDPDEKQEAMENGSYFEWVETIEKMHPGHIDIQIDIYKSNSLRVTIDDYGNGFEPERIEQNITDEYDYHGRGLTMIAQMIDGLFYAKNGSQVIYYLRYDTPDWDEFTPDTLNAFNGLRLLFIGEENASMFDREFSPQVKEIFTAGSSAEGINNAREFRPNFVIIDLEKRNGSINLIGQLYAVLGDIPVICFMEEYNEDLFIEAMQRGLDMIAPRTAQPLKYKEAILKVLQYRQFRQGNMQIQLQKVEQKRDLRAQNQYYREEQARAFEKQKRVIHNDSSSISWVEQQLFYRPLEILSGDIYGIHKIERDSFCTYIVDSMGKGLSASVTSILSAAFINRALTRAKESGSFSMERLVDDFIAFVTPNLLEDEVLSFAFAYCNRRENRLQYVGFGMYPLLLTEKNSESIDVLKCHYPPLMRNSREYTISHAVLPEHFELLFYSDGLCEMEGFAIMELIELFKKSNGYTAFNNSLQEALKAEEQTDDFTMLYFSSTD